MLNNEKLQDHASKLGNLVNVIETEEATKTSMIMPFFQLLGYDIFNPTEFIPEYTADVGIKKGEKVDYAIVIDEKPLILVECKSCNENLDKHSSQLFRYFGTSEAKFGILTNGISYQFYTDLEDSNKMDPSPFLNVDLLNMQERDINELSKFTKESLDVDSIISSAENLKYNRLIKAWLIEEIDNPSSDFVRLILSNIYEGNKSQKVIEKFTPLVKKAFTQYINDLLNTKIKTALSKDNEESEDEIEEEVIESNKIETTIEELEAYAIVKSILIKSVSGDRITYRDNASYFNILLDDNARKWICRAHFNQTHKYITLPGENKTNVRYNIDKLDDIYNYSDEIIAVCNSLK